MWVVANDRARVAPLTLNLNSINGLTITQPPLSEMIGIDPKVPVFYAILASSDAQTFGLAFFMDGEEDQAKACLKRVQDALLAGVTLLDLNTPATP